MRAQCPFGYRIVDEQETRIAYACKDASPASTTTKGAPVREVGVSI
jgi:hypothetical protein